MRKGKLIATLIFLGNILLCIALLLAVIETFATVTDGECVLSALINVFFCNHGGLYFIISLISGALLSASFVVACLTILKNHPH